ncbi:MAG: 50S ribosomal protein L30 [Dehalococcoidia bacterium DG_18]|nr:MAG: 50S ribosomal protein L30 [Dehalococcoidia bacterium DG_18]
MSKLHITWKKSAIGYNKRQRMTLKALGFRSLNHTIVRSDSAAIRGMIDKVRHLVRVEEVAEE